MCNIATLQHCIKLNLVFCFQPLMTMYIQQLILRSSQAVELLRIWPSDCNARQGNVCGEFADVRHVLDAA